MLKRLNELFDDWKLGGIFTYLSYVDDDIIPPWVENEPDGLEIMLNFDYHGNFSGDKFISPFLRKFIEGETLTTDELNGIASAIAGIYHTKWTGLWATLNPEYNPIENYNMEENLTDAYKTTEHGHKIRRDDNLTNTQSPDNWTVTNENDIYAFNSSSANHADKNTTKTTGTYATTSTGYQEHTNSGTDTEREGHKLTRKGNIGVTTTQRMLEQERNIKNWDFFRQIVFPDIDKILTIMIY